MADEANKYTLTEKQREMVIDLLSSDTLYTDAEIAKECDIPINEIQRVIYDDPDLCALRRYAERDMVQKIERSAMDLAIKGRNEMARQKSQEFMLRKLKPEVYGDNADAFRDRKDYKRILLVKELPVIPVDENGIPIARSHSPLEPKEADARMI